MGDSLSERIDAGLVRSKYGAVVLSPAFFAKAWPRRELAGLVAREVGHDKVILPIWYEVDHGDVLRFSPPLADKLAIVASESAPIESAGLQLLEVVRPDISRHLLMVLEDRRRRGELPIEWVDVEDIELGGPIRHHTFSREFLLRLRVVHEALQEVFPASWELAVGNFKRDVHPEEQLVIMERLASAYLATVNEYPLVTDERRALWTALLHLSLGSFDADSIDNPPWLIAGIEAYAWDGSMPAEPRPEEFNRSRRSGPRMPVKIEDSPPIADHE